MKYLTHILVIIYLFFPISICATESGLKSWAVRALELQNHIDKYAPLKRAIFPYVHNAYNSKAYYSIIPPKYWDPNHNISIPQQLDLGMRSFQLDLHWERFANISDIGLILCHDSLDKGLCSIYDRKFREALREYKEWFSKNNRRQTEVIIIDIEDHIFIKKGYEEATKSIKEEIEALVYTTETPCKNLSMDITKAKVLAKGKNIIFTSAQSKCYRGGNTGYGQYVHGYWYMTLNLTCFAGYPICNGLDDEKNCVTPLTIKDKLYRTWNDGTSYGRIIKKEHVFTFKDVEMFTKCGVSMVGPEPLVKEDPRLEAHIWSWARDQPDNSKHCAEQKSDGRFYSRNCDRKGHFACQNVDDPRYWKITSKTGKWIDGETACTHEFGDKYKFLVPVNGYENARLVDERNRNIENDDILWVSYTNLPGKWETKDSDKTWSQQIKEGKERLGPVQTPHTLKIIQ